MEELSEVEVGEEKENEVEIVKDVLVTGAKDGDQIETTDGKELVLPAIKECILNVDMQSKKMKVHILEGLLD